MRTVLHIRAGGSMLGAERVVLDLCRHSEEFGYRPVVAMPWDAGTAEPELLSLARGAGIETLALNCRSPFSPGSFRQLRRFARQRVHVIHSHGYREDLYAWAAGRTLPRVATNHLWKLNTLRLRLYAAVDARLLRSFDHVVGVSQPIVEEMRALGIARTSMIANGLSTDRFVIRPAGPARDRRRRELGLPLEETVVAMVSSLTPEKGHAYALQAMQRLHPASPALHLAIVGDGPLADELAREVVARGLSEGVTFLGRRSDIPEILSVSDIFLLSSTAEGLPIALLEAMAAGCPVVATAVGEIPNVITDGTDGLLVPLDPARIAQGLGRLAGDEARRKAMGMAARSTVDARFSSRRMTREYCELYDRVID